MSNPQVSKKGRELSARFAKSYSASATVDRYFSVYVMFQVAQILISVGLAILSYHFWLGLFAAKLSPAIAAGVAVLCTAGYSGIIYVIINTVFKTWYADEPINWTITILLIAMILGDGLYMNWHGITPLTESMIEKPVDTATPIADSRYKGQTADIKAELQRLKSRASTLRNAKGSGITVKGGASHWKGNLTKFGKRELRRVESAITNQNTALEKVRGEWNAQVATLSEAHQSNVMSYTDKLTSRIDNLRGINLIGYALLMIIVAWCHWYGAKSAEQAGVTKYAPENPPQHPGPGNGSGKRFSRSYDGDEDALFEELARIRRDMNDLRNHKHTPDIGDVLFGGERNQGKDETLRVMPMHPKSPAKNYTFLEGKGFVIQCDHCGKESFHKRIPFAGQHSFCSKDCKQAFHANKRKLARQNNAS